MAIVLHIATRADWEAAELVGSYAAASLRREGFIHCSTPAQVVATANALFKGRRDLVLLCIDTERARAELRFEAPVGAGDSAERFPHLYGPVELAAVVRVCAFPPRADGTFALPPSLGDALG